MTNLTSKISLRVALTETLAEELALVLTSERLSPSIWRGEDGYVLGVPLEEVKRAAKALSDYESENPVELQKEDETVGSSHILVALAVGGVLFAFYFVTVELYPAIRWFERGSADAKRILLGELWRVVTALTLHIDMAHALTNTIAGVLFLIVVCRTLGAGLGCALVLLAGAGGNFVNAFLHGPFHIAVGASTSVFGALGILGGLGVTRRYRRGVRGRRAWVPIAAALALLAMLGTTGQRVDFWAHLFGLLVGGMLSIPVSILLPHPPGIRYQWALGAATLSVIIACWFTALR